MRIDMRENRKRENDVKLHAAIRYREVANSVRVVLRAVAIEVHEMRARISESSLLDDGAINVDAPVVLMVHVVTGAREESANIPAKIENFASFPKRMVQHFVEVRKLRQSRRDKVPGERTTVSEERLRGVEELLLVVY